MPTKLYQTLLGMPGKVISLLVVFLVVSTKHIATQLQNDSKLTFEIIHNLLDAHFPPSIHGDILQAVNIEPTLRVFGTRRRDSHFRENVLRAYEYKCAICGFDVKLGHSPIGLEASHIKWHAAGGT